VIKPVLVQFNRLGEYKGVPLIGNNIILTVITFFILAKSYLARDLKSGKARKTCLVVYAHGKLRTAKSTTGYGGATPA
jgi:hypothetical protein